MTPPLPQVRALVEAALRGDRAALMRLRRRVMNAPQRDNARTLCTTLADLLDPEAATATPEGTPWRSGAVTDAPFGLGCLDELNDCGTISWSSGFVWLTPAAGARRLLAPALGLLPAVHQAQAQRAVSDRTGTALAALALANQAGLSSTALVRAAHGVVFVPRRHQDMLDVLVHRMREYVGDCAVIDRHATSRLVLRPRTAFVLVDPRCRHTVHAVVVRLLSRKGPHTTAQLAATLGVAYRTMQRVLTGMVQEHACMRRMRGRSVEYHASPQPTQG